MTVSPEQLQERFRYRVHSTEGPGQMQAKQTLAEVLLAAAGVVSRMTPSSREQSLSLTCLEQAFFWAMASIDREQASGGNGPAQ